MKNKLFKKSGDTSIRYQITRIWKMCNTRYDFTMYDVINTKTPDMQPLVFGKKAFNEKFEEVQNETV